MLVCVAAEERFWVETLCPGFLNDCSAGVGDCFVVGYYFLEFDLGVEEGLEGGLDVGGVVVIVGMTITTVAIAVAVIMFIVGMVMMG